jgi:aspartate/methionine/tyrosine aminotransferase
MAGTLNGGTIADKEETMAQFQPFKLERMLCRWENTVEYDLSESGVHPVSLNELVDADPNLIEALLETKLNYAQSNGVPELRERIAALYPGATKDNVIVTVGCAEANFLATQTVLQPGDEVAIMLPNYMQIPGIIHNYGLRARSFQLREEKGWGLDIDSINAAVTTQTKLIAVCNPNNPTGHILTEPEMKAVITAAEKVGAWLLADEVYSGTERLSDEQTQTFWGRYDKVLAMNSLSKAYGLPGLRIGWAVGPTDTIQAFWARHDYTTIGATMLGNKLAEIALRPDVRPRLVGRARELVRHGLPILEDWLASFDGLFHMIAPQASPVAFVRYSMDINSTEFVDRVRQEKSVLLIPGDHFGKDGYLRFRYGLPPVYLNEGLKRIGEVVGSIRTMQ